MRKVNKTRRNPEFIGQYAECRHAWPDKVFWANINVDLYAQPENVLRQAVIDKRNRAGKRGLALLLPSNHFQWGMSI